MKLLDYLSAKTSSIVMILLSLTVAVLAVITFYTFAPKINPVIGRDKIETIVIDTLNNEPSVDVVLYVQINLENNSRKLISSAVRDVNDQPLVDIFQKFADNTKFISNGNVDFVKSLLVGSVHCQDKANLNPAVVSIIKAQLIDLPAFKTCSLPVQNKANVLVGYVAVIWKTSPGVEQELTTMLKIQTGINSSK